MNDTAIIRGLQDRIRSGDMAIATLRAENEALRKDAQRYRAIVMRLRDIGGYTIGIIEQHAFSEDAQLLVGSEADAAIDAALETMAPDRTVSE